MTHINGEIRVNRPIPGTVSTDQHSQAGMPASPCQNRRTASTMRGIDWISSSQVSPSHGWLQEEVAVKIIPTTRSRLYLRRISGSEMEQRLLAPTEQNCARFRSDTSTLQEKEASEMTRHRASQMSISAIEPSKRMAIASTPPHAMPGALRRY